MIDWSHSQVSKHDKELQALVGNLFMRVTSATMMSRVKEALHNPDGAAELSEDLRLAFRELSDASAALAGKVKGNLDEMEVADALDSVVDLLRLVGDIFLILVLGSNDGIYRQTKSLVTQHRGNTLLLMYLSSRIEVV